MVVLIIFVEGLIFHVFRGVKTAKGVSAITIPHLPFTAA